MAFKNPSLVTRSLNNALHQPQRCHFSTTQIRPATPFLNMAAMAHAKESYHFNKTSGLGVVNHTPSLEAIKNSEVEPFKKDNKKTVAVVSGAVAAVTSKEKRKTVNTKPEHEWWVHKTERTPDPLLQPGVQQMTALQAKIVEMEEKQVLLVESFNSQLSSLERNLEEDREAMHREYSSYNRQNSRNLWIWAGLTSLGFYTLFSEVEPFASKRNESNARVAARGLEASSTRTGHEVVATMTAPVAVVGEMIRHDNVAEPVLQQSGALRRGFNSLLWSS